MVLCVVAIGSADFTLAQSKGGGDAAAADGGTVASHFDDFLHYAVLGRFKIADGHARELLNHPNLDPIEVLKLSQQHARSVETLIILIKNSPVGDNASRILELIHEGEYQQRKQTDRILADIEKLGGLPQMEYNAVRRLADSGEYAIHWMIQTLRDETQKSLWPRVIRALPQIGKPAVKPLVEALAINDQNIRQTIIQTLGEIGYGQAVPYLLAVANDSTALPETRQAAVAAIARIEKRSGRSFGGMPAVEFIRLAERFYNEHGSVRADVRLRQANIWYWDEANQFIERVAVPQPIFGQVMAMRACERALLIDPNQPDAIALWLAANIRRESRLGFDVEIGDPDASGGTDPTRPPHFPRALYFTSAAGARYAHMVLDRAVADLDAPVALGAIAALRRVAGPSSLIGSEDYKQPFLQALKFPDLVVRVRAALALGNALPQTSVAGAERVIPILGDAMVLTGRRNLLVIDDDESRRNQLVGELRNADTNVIGAATTLEGLDRASAEFDSLSAVFLSASVGSPDVQNAVVAVRTRREFALTPIVLMVEPAQSDMANRIAASDHGVGMVDAGVGAPMLMTRLAEVAQRTGQTPVSPDLAHELGLEAAATLQRIATDGKSIFHPLYAEKAAIAALNAPHEDLQIAAVGVNALLPSAKAQTAIAAVALKAGNTESLRVAAFDGLSESAKRFGNQLDGKQIDELLMFSFDEPNLRLRTAASQALGALNVVASKASQIPLKYHRG